jgi:hypothetical protein
MTTDEFEFGTTAGHLQFNQSLVTKSLTTPMLCSRLKELHEELSKLDQQVVVKDSLSSVKKELFTLISHKDRYVKILVACCISDILRLYAPDAPFNTSQLKVLCIDSEHFLAVFQTAASCGRSLECVFLELLLLVGLDFEYQGGGSAR